MSDDEQRFPRFVHKPRPVMEAQRSKRQARDELDRRVESAAGVLFRDEAVAAETRMFGTRHGAR